VDVSVRRWRFLWPDPPGAPFGCVDCCVCHTTVSSAVSLADGKGCGGRMAAAMDGRLWSSRSVLWCVTSFLAIRMAAFSQGGMNGASVCRWKPRAGEALDMSRLI